MQGNLPFHYKGHVMRGNNGQLVKQLFKTRYWWLLHDKDEMDKVNFMWTQLRKQDLMK
jgi:tubulin---tyrosine ligase